MALESVSRLSAATESYVLCASQNPCGGRQLHSCWLSTEVRTPKRAVIGQSIQKVSRTPHIGGEGEQRRQEKTCCCASLQPDVPGPANEARSMEAEDAEGLSLQIERLERDLDDAVESEDYGTAARLRDQLKVLQEDNIASVVAANKMFYACFQRGDSKGMGRLWARGDHIGVVHPGANLISGRDDVMASWELILGSFKTVRVVIELENIQVHVNGRTAVVTCIEVMSGDRVGGRVVATNIFEWHDGRWLMMLHHGSGAAISF